MTSEEASVSSKVIVDVLTHVIVVFINGHASCLSGSRGLQSLPLAIEI